MHLLKIRVINPRASVAVTSFRRFAFIRGLQEFNTLMANLLLVKDYNMAQSSCNHKVTYYIIIDSMQLNNLTQHLRGSEHKYINKLEVHKINNDTKIILLHGYNNYGGVHVL